MVSATWSKISKRISKKKTEEILIQISNKKIDVSKIIIFCFLNSDKYIGISSVIRCVIYYYLIYV